MKSTIRLVVAMICIAAAGAVVTGTPAVADSDKKVTEAWFGDHWIDMADDWESATACAVSDSGAVCFTTEAEMDVYLAATGVAAAGGAVIAAACSSTLRLYDGTSYTGSVLQLSTQFTFLNLGNYGFNNLTSSYKVGACSSYFYSSASGGGSLYPTGNTQAFDQFPSMLVGWNNTISSVYIT